MERDEVAGHMRECARSSCDAHVSSSDDDTIYDKRYASCNSGYGAPRMLMM
jgi:hypothetical protein